MDDEKITEHSNEDFGIHLVFRNFLFCLDFNPKNRAKKDKIYEELCLHIRQEKDFYFECDFVTYKKLTNYKLAELIKQSEQQRRYRAQQKLLKNQ